MKEVFEGLGVVCMIIVIVAMARLCGLFVGHIWAAFIGVAVGLLCGVSKELYDTRKKDFVDVKDYVMPSERCCFWSYTYKHKRK